MPTELTVMGLHEQYQSLFKSSQDGNLRRCLDFHLRISSYLQDSGAHLLAVRHQNMAHKISQIMKLLQARKRTNGSLSDDDCQQVSAIPVQRGYFLESGAVEGLELKIINVLSEGPKTQAELLRLLFEGYATDLFSQKYLSRLIDGINRKIARIIKISECGYFLTIKSSDEVQEFI